MIVKIDKGAVGEFVFMTSTPEYGEMRSYYASTTRLMIIVCRDGLELNSLGGALVDAQVGWDMGYPGFALAGNEYQRHSKLTVFRLARRGRYAKTLRELLHAAPKMER